jgi:Uma2 family endonuclease
MASSALAGKLRKRFTPVEYLRMERAALEKSEYYDGEIFAMAGAREAHDLIGGNVYVAFRSSLRSHGCEAYSSDMKVAVTSAGPFFYPDVSLACGERKFRDARRDVLLNPSVIVEVLSKSTERFDRVIKVKEYQRIPTVNAILLVSTERIHVEVHTRAGRSWKRHDVSGLASFVEIASPPCVLPLADIYDSVELQVL